MAHGSQLQYAVAFSSVLLPVFWLAYMMAFISAWLTAILSARWELHASDSTSPLRTIITPQPIGSGDVCASLTA
jgi:hypothetical protein